ncbi:MAG: phage integrase N-terminal SAM-like domain-containing protein [Gammaproteobacteria bacterium]
MEQKHPPKLLDQVRTRIRYLHLSSSTEQAYVYWVRRFIFSKGKQHPKIMGGDEIERFLNYLATELQVSASTQNQSMNTIVFL